jgi:hypothetical protein
MINFVLAAIVVFLGIKAYGIWAEDKESLPDAGTAKGPPPLSAKTFSKISLPPQSDYDAIVNHNLFSMGRSPDGVEKEEVKPEVKTGTDEKLVKLLESTIKQISVYGVMIIDGEKKALIKSPALPVSDGSKRRPAPHAGEETKWVKVGEGLNRFTVNDIKASGVVLGAEGLAFDVDLYDKDKPKERAPVRKAEGPVVVGGKGVAGGEATSKVSKETKKEQLPEPASTPTAVPDKEKKNMQRTTPQPDDSGPAAVPNSKNPRLLPNRPGPDRR